MKRTGVVKDERYMNHDPGAYHPESPRRLEVIYQMLEEDDMKGLLAEITPEPAPEEHLLWVHTESLVKIVKSTAGKPSYSLDPDTSTSPGSYEAALLAVGGVCKAISLVMNGDLDNAFALIRPPGHHAERARAMGFCLFNNVAIGARYAQKQCGVERILIIDWDLHHGNGTQHIFEDDPTVLYFSTHQYPYYPGSGSFQEVGTGKGEGYTVNVPLSAGYGDGEYVAIYQNILRPIGLEFKPDLVLVSAGFDIYKGDPLGGMEVTAQGFGALARSILDMAQEACEGKVVLCLEGGYNLQGLREGVRAVLRDMADAEHSDLGHVIQKMNKRAVDNIIEASRKVHGKYWSSLGN